MRIPSLVAAAGIALVLCTSAAHSQSWKSLQLSTTGLNPEPSVLTSTWLDVMRADAAALVKSGATIFIQGKETTLPNRAFRPARFLSTTFEHDDTTYTVSIMLQVPPGCDNGANSNTADQINVICPARVSTQKKGERGITAIIERDGVCAIEPTAIKDPAQDATQASFDGKTVLIRSIQNGRVIAGCNTSIPVN